jgi:hypothetical protein
MSILPSPLHPAIVHLPIAIAVLLPLFALGALWAIHKGVRSMWAWGVPVSLLSLLLLSGLAAKQTGGADGERMEHVVGEQAVESHEEAAEGFIVATGAVLALALVGFARARVGTIARGVTAAGTIALLGLGYNVGHSGGAMVYRDGSTLSASSMGAPASGSELRSGADANAEDDDDADDEDDD